MRVDRNGSGTHIGSGAVQSGNAVKCIADELVRSLTVLPDMAAPESGTIAKLCTVIIFGVFHVLLHRKIIFTDSTKINRPGHNIRMY